MSELYKYFKRCTGHGGIYPSIKGQNRKIVTDQIRKAYSPNTYYASLFSRERNNPQIHSTVSGKPFNIRINIIRKLLSTIGKKKSVGRFGIPGEILKIVGEAMIPFLARLRDIIMNYNAIPGYCKKALGFPIYKVGDRSVIGNYRPVSLTWMV